MQALIDLDGNRVTLLPGRLSDWVTLTFRAAPGIKVTGITRLLVTEMDEHFSLYVSPINLDPETPAMPISHPSYYATYLAKRIGTFATLGLAEDTWALNEGVTDDGTFLQQTYDIDREREAMFFAALDRLRAGSARLRVRRHRSHPAHVLALPRAGSSGGARPRAMRHTVTRFASCTSSNDALVGRVMAQLRDGDVLMVISDHGFSSFRRGVNLNQLAAAARATWRSRTEPTARASGCATSTGRGRGLLPRPHRDVPQPEGARGSRASSSPAPRPRR